MQYNALGIGHYKILLLLEVEVSKYCIILKWRVLLEIKGMVLI